MDINKFISKNKEKVIFVTNIALILSSIIGMFSGLFLIWTWFENKSIEENNIKEQKIDSIPLLYIVQNITEKENFTIITPTVHFIKNNEKYYIIDNISELHTIRYGDINIIGTGGSPKYRILLDNTKDFRISKGRNAFNIPAIMKSNYEYNYDENNYTIRSEYYIKILEINSETAYIGKSSYEVKYKNNLNISDILKYKIEIIK